MLITHIFQDKLPFNYLTQDNNAKIFKCSSSINQYPPENLLINISYTAWISSDNTPQEIVFKLRNIIGRPNVMFTVFGVYLQYEIKNNPKIIEVLFSKDNKEYESFGVFELKLQKGIQLFKMKESDIVEQVIYGEWKYNYCKVIIKETYGGNRRCYVNKFFMFDDVREDISMMEHRLNENIEKIKEKRDYEEKREQMFFNEIQKGNELVDNDENKVMNKENRKAFCNNNNELEENNRKLIKKITNLIKDPNTFIATQKRRNKNTLKSYLNDLSISNESDKDTTSPPPTTWNGLNNNLDNIYHSIEDMKQPIRPKEQFEYNNDYTDADEFTRNLSFILYKKDYAIYNKKNKI